MLSQCTRVLLFLVFSPWLSVLWHLLFYISRDQKGTYGMIVSALPGMMLLLCARFPYLSIARGYKDQTSWGSVSVWRCQRLHDNLFYGLGLQPLALALSAKDCVLWACYATSRISHTAKHWIESIAMVYPVHCWWETQTPKNQNDFQLFPPRHSIWLLRFWTSFLFCRSSSRPLGKGPVINQLFNVMCVYDNFQLRLKLVDTRQRRMLSLSFFENDVHSLSSWIGVWYGITLIKHSILWYRARRSRSFARGESRHPTPSKKVAGSCAAWLTLMFFRIPAGPAKGGRELNRYDSFMTHSVWSCLECTGASWEMYLTCFSVFYWI